MSNNIFGTDGIRGRANDGLITPHNMIDIAVAVATHYYAKLDHSPKIIIGKDTRVSCYMLENALTSGFLSCGCDVVLLGPMPTPSISFLTKSLRADIGVMISASHNPYYDNGIKLFDGNGIKLGPDDEEAISAIFNRNRQCIIQTKHGSMFESDYKSQTNNKSCKRTSVTDADQNNRRNANTSGNVGQAKRLDDVAGRYIEFCKYTFPKNLNLSDVRMCLL